MYASRCPSVLTRDKRRRAAYAHGIASAVPSRLPHQHVLCMREFAIVERSSRFVLFNRMASAQILRSSPAEPTRPERTEHAGSGCRVSTRAGHLRWVVDENLQNACG